MQVRGIGKTFDSLGPSVFSELKSLRASNALERVPRSSAASFHSVYFDGVGRVGDTPIFLLEKLSVGHVVEGPAIVIDETQTIVLVPGSEAVVCVRHLVLTVPSRKDEDNAK